MKRLSVLIDGSSKELYLDESFLIDNDNPYLSQEGDFILGL